MEPQLSYSDLFPAFLREVFRPGKQVFREVQAGSLHMLRNLRQQMLRIFVDLHPVRLGRFHQAVDNRAGLSTVDGVNDVPVGPPNGKGMNGALRCRIVKLELQFFKFIRDHPDTRLHGLTINFLPINQINLDEGIKFKNVRSITDDRLNYPAYLHTVTLSELYETSYPSRPPLIDGLLYPGTYPLAGAPKVGKSFLVASVLDVSPKAIDLPDIDSYIGLMHTFFALEERYGLKIGEVDGELCLRLDKSKGSDYLNLFDMFISWQREAAKLEAGEITKEEYDQWRYKYPEFDNKPGWVKTVPSQGLNDLIVNALKENVD